MKKFLSMIVAASFLSLVACGPAAEEQNDAQAEADAIINELEAEVSEEATEEVAEEAAETEEAEQAN
jgi:glycerate-2-kinase